MKIELFSDKIEVHRGAFRERRKDMQKGCKQFNRAVLGVCIFVFLLTGCAKTSGERIFLEEEVSEAAGQQEMDEEAHKAEADDTDAGTIGTGG